MIREMKVNELTHYYHLPCRFRLRSGKEICGVIWPGAAGECGPLNFASSADYGRWRSELNQTMERRWTRLWQQEIIAAKRLG